MNGKYGERSQTSCAQIDFQWLLKSLKHSFKNHKDGYTRERQVLQNFEKWFSFIPIFNGQIYIDII